MGYMLETRGLTKRFGRGDQAQDAVADVSLHIREGEVYGLLGPNGASKSTTLKMICGMLRPTAGEILFAGHAWRREDLYAIGGLIEEAPLYPNLTARENLRVRTTLLGLPESRVDEVLAAVDLADTGKKRAGRFSMGMRQRLGLALALIARPRLLVLDEPTNGLDPIGIEELRDQIRGFAAAGTTVIVSSHILSEVQQMADTIGVICGGRLAYEDALTARVAEEDAVAAYGLGADDYVRKPFGAAELRAKVAAHLRRERRPRSHAISFGEVRIDLGARGLAVGGEAVPLTPTEYAICEYLARHPGQVMSRAQIREAVLGWESDADDAAISMQVSRARRKLSEAGADPIATVWGMRYKWQL